MIKSTVVRTFFSAMTSQFPRIISLLPSATEILFALGADDLIVGRSSECNYPDRVKKVPIVVNSLIKSQLSSKYIDKNVSQSLKNGQSLYQVRKKLFASLKPDLVITQKLCEVCAITPTNIQSALRDCQPLPNLITLHPHSISEIFTDIQTVGVAIGKTSVATKQVKQLKNRLEKIKQKTKNLKKPKVYCLEWLDPPYNAGHWVPEQIEIAGGRDDLATKGVDSVRILWQKILKYNPDFLILMPCGFSINRTKKELDILKKKPEWLKLKAIQTNQVYLVNGPAYFNCSGPRIVDGTELLAHILNPSIFPNRFTNQDFVKLPYEKTS